MDQLGSLVEEVSELRLQRGGHAFVTVGLWSDGAHVDVALHPHGGRAHGDGATVEQAANACRMKLAEGGV